MPLLTNSIRFRDDNSHLTVLSHIVYQDVMWLDTAAKDIATHRLPAYFAHHEAAPIHGLHEYFIVIPAVDEIKQIQDGHSTAWRLLAARPFQVALYPSMETETPASRWCVLPALTAQPSPRGL